jgi:hypothetical protein
MKDLNTIEKNVRKALLTCLTAYKDILFKGDERFKTDLELMAMWYTAATQAVERGSVFIVPKNISDSWQENGGVFAHETMGDYRLPYPMTIYISLDTDTCEVHDVLFAAEVKETEDDCSAISEIVDEWVDSKLVCHEFRGLEAMNQGSKTDKFEIKFANKISLLRLAENVSLVPSAEAMMNAQSTVEHHVMPLPAKLAKKRLAKNQHSSVHGFTLLGIQRGMTANEISAEPYKVTAHLRRGHWKNRKTGTFWWDSCVVGSGEVKTRTGYIH